MYTIIKTQYGTYQTASPLVKINDLVPVGRVQARIITIELVNTKVQS